MVGPSGHGLLPPLLVSAAIVIIGVTIAVRSGESQGRKLLFVIAMVLAFAVPAFLITVPVASMRFEFHPAAREAQARRPHPHMKNSGRNGSPPSSRGAVVR